MVNKHKGSRPPSDPRALHYSSYLCPMNPVGDGTRALNFLIDTLVIFTLAFFSFKGWNWYVRYWGYRPFNFGWFFFGIAFLYYTLFETLFARSPAKWFTYTRVFTKTGTRPGIVRIILRSLLRLTLIDLFFNPFLGMPLHDYVSGTRVCESDPVKTRR